MCQYKNVSKCDISFGMCMQLVWGRLDCHLHLILEVVCMLLCVSHPSHLLCCVIVCEWPFCLPYKIPRGRSVWLCSRTCTLIHMYVLFFEIPELSVIESVHLVLKLLRVCDGSSLIECYYKSLVCTHCWSCLLIQSICLYTKLAWGTSCGVRVSICIQCRPHRW